jgi:hypothetical protein
MVTGRQGQFTLQDFKTRVLHPLLDDAPPTQTGPVFLFVASVDRPERYVFESDRWQDAIGGGRLLIRAGEKMAAALAAEGFLPTDFFHADGLGFFVLIHDSGLVERWRDLLGRTLAEATAIGTLSVASFALDAMQVHHGLYRTPTTVLGVPGVNDYQARINHYYGIEQPSVVPRGEAVSNRHHFGECLMAIRALRDRERESPCLVPFYDAPTFALRCETCRTRPAERFDRDLRPICGVCQTRREAGGDLGAASRDLVWIEALGLERILADQRTGGAYRRLYMDIDETLRVAATGETLLCGEGRILFAAEKGLLAAINAMDAIRAQYDRKPPLPFAAVVTIGAAPAQLYRLAAQAIQTMARGTDMFAIDVRRSGLPFDRFQKPLSIDEARARCQA